MIYRTRKNVIIDENGKQVAIVLATNCTKKDAAMMAAFAAQAMNDEQRRQEYRKTLP